jgi:hypothetical protein
MAASETPTRRLAELLREAAAAIREGCYVDFWDLVESAGEEVARRLAKQRPNLLADNRMAPGSPPNSGKTIRDLARELDDEAFRLEQLAKEVRRG